MNTYAKLILDCATNQIPMEYADMQPRQREDAIRAEILKSIGLDKYDAKAYKKAMSFTHNREKVFAIIGDVLEQTVLNGEAKKSSFYNQFVDEKSNALGDKNEFYIEGETELVMAEFSGSHWDLKRQRLDRGQTLSMEVRSHGIKVYEYFERAMAGRCDFAELIAKIEVAMDKYIGQMTQVAFASALDSLPTEFKVQGTYDKTKILEMLAHVEASTGEKPVLVGTRVGLSKLQNVQHLSNNMMDTLNAQGFLPVWEGYTCVELEQGHKIGTFEFTMDNSTVLALPVNAKPVKLYLEGEVEFKEINDGTSNADRSMEYTCQFKAGCGVAYNKLIGTIEFNN